MDYQTIGLAFSQILVVAFAAWYLGQFAVARYWHFDNAALRVSVSLSLGLLVVSHAVFLLACFHALTQGAIYTLFALLIVMAVIGLFKSVSRLERLTSEPFWIWAIFAGFFIYFIWILLCSCLPPTARDELIYHLEVPKQIYKHGGFFQFLDNFYAYFPSLGEMLFLLGLASVGELAAKFYHPFWGVVLVLTTYGFSRSHLSKKASLAATALLICIPSVMVTMTQAYVDLTYAVYFLIAWIAALEFFKNGKLVWAVLIGVMIGAAISTKYTGIQFLILMECLVMVEYLFSQRKETWAALMIIGAVALIIGSPYLIRNWYFTGWPLFPFRAGDFTLNPAMNWEGHRSQLYMGWLNTFGTPLGENSITHSLLSSILVFIQGKFQAPEFYDGVLSPVFLLIPVLFWKTPKDSMVKRNLIFSVLFLYYWVFTTKQIRFLMPILPVFSFLLVYGIQLKKNQRVWIAAAFIFSSAALVQGWVEIDRLRPLGFWQGKESRDEYLARNIESYPIYQKAGELLKPTDRLYLINMRNYGYYLNVPWRGDYVFERYQVDKMMETAVEPQDVLAFFKAHGITHLMVDMRYISSPNWGFGPEKFTLFQGFLAQYTQTIFEYGGMSLYQLN